MNLLHNAGQMGSMCSVHIFLALKESLDKNSGYLSLKVKQPQGLELYGSFGAQITRKRARKILKLLDTMSNSSLEPAQVAIKKIFSCIPINNPTAQKLKNVTMN